MEKAFFMADIERDWTVDRHERRAEKRYVSDLNRSVCAQIILDLAEYMRGHPPPDAGLEYVLRQLGYETAAFITLTDLVRHIDLGWDGEAERVGGLWRSVS
jgi:hypothetical protein